MALARFLVDTSAIVRYANPKVAARLDDLTMAAQAVTCGVVELQLLGSVLDVAIRTRVVALRAVAFEVLETIGTDLQRALEVQTLLAERGERHVAWPALVIAAVSERHAVTVLHCDPHYDVIGKVTGQSVEWVVSSDQT